MDLRHTKALTRLGRALLSSAGLPRFCKKALKALRSTGMPLILLRTASKAGASTGPLLTMNFQYDLGSVSGRIT